MWENNRSTSCTWSAPSWVSSNTSMTRLNFAGEIFKCSRIAKNSIKDAGKKPLLDAFLGTFSSMEIMALSIPSGSGHIQHLCAASRTKARSSQSSSRSPNCSSFSAASTTLTNCGPNKSTSDVEEVVFLFLFSAFAIPTPQQRKWKIPASRRTSGKNRLRIFSPSATAVIPSSWSINLSRCSTVSNARTTSSCMSSGSDSRLPISARRVLR
mmetsp:Transcript_13976/g.34552  ORF Transcript_13976/g.34552 Transcript_13976/m.34552 type:complete len:211 (+) Transcript_13976:1136-1768(+)